MKKTMVPYIPGGLDSCRAEVLGLTREGEQVVLRIEVEEIVNGQYVKTERIFQRDRYTIEGLTRDSQRAEFVLRVLRHKDG